jgi:hypothetical protein
VLTGVAGAGSLTAVGLFAGLAGHQYAQQQAREDRAHAKAEAADARAKARYDAALESWRLRAERAQTVFRQRPSRTVVHTRYTQAAPSVTLGGGTITSHSAPQPAAPPSSGNHPAPPPPAPPAPNPPPAPSSGS